MRGWAKRAGSCRKPLAVTSTVLFLAVVLPGQASAACGVTPPLVGWQLAVGLSHGYCLTVTPTDASPFGGGTVLVTQVTKGSLQTGLTRMGYRIHLGTWSDQWKSLHLARVDNWMTLSLGHRGVVDATFHPLREAALHPPDGCAGQNGREVIGVWRGRIRFTGEHGYAKVKASSTPGTVVLKQPQLSDPSCGQVTTVGPTYIPGPFSAETLTLGVDGGGPFDATLVQGVSTVQFRAETKDCSVERLAPARDITVSNDLDWNAQTPPSSATLTPPAPFRGTATYASGSISGTLSYYCPNEQRYVPVGNPAPANWTFFP